MQLNRYNNKERQCCLESAAFHTWACARSHVLFDWSVFSITGTSVLFAWQFMGPHLQGFPPPPTSLPLFHCSHSVTGACSPFCVGAYGWLARICQPWERSPSKSWLPMVESQTPSLHFAMQLLNYEIEVTVILLSIHVHVSTAVLIFLKAALIFTTGKERVFDK